MKTLLKYFVSVLLVFPFLCKAQTTAELVKRTLNSKITGVFYQVQLKNFYEHLAYEFQWVTHEKTNARETLFNLFAVSEFYGLNNKDYQFSLVESLKQNTPIKSIDDSIRTDILLSDAVLHFFNDLAFGNAAPGIGYNGLGYKPESFDVSEKLWPFVEKNDIAVAIEAFEPSMPEYTIIKNKLIQLLTIKNRPGFSDTIVTSPKLNISNLSLLTRLHQLGFLDGSEKKLSDAQLKQTCKQAQKLFNVKQEEILSKIFIYALNIPVATRIEELKIALNQLRWLQKARQTEDVVLVNIPSANLLVYDNNRLILGSKIIVGKSSTPTPTFTSRISEIILYPYWHVPNKIAVNELLPAVKRNVGYLDANNYQVLNRNGAVVSPWKINWSSLSASNFPYIIRQSTGCDNSLGIVKLNFYTPYGVYLHDTPGKSLFSYQKRYYSHGCMRVEKAIELAHLVLKGNEIAIDTLEEKGCLLHQSPLVVPANNQMALFVLYNTAWIDQDMNIIFCDDVYKKNKAVFKNK